MLLAELNNQGMGNLIALLGIISGLIAFSFGIYQYIKGQEWKRAEFVVNLIDKFESQIQVKNAMLMLDWNSRQIVFSDKTSIYFEDNILEHALTIHTRLALGDEYTEDESKIRDAFDVFFDGLQRFDQHIELGLLNADDLRPYILYWIELIGNENPIRKSNTIIKIMWEYIHYYGYSGVQTLCIRYGYDITPSEEFLQEINKIKPSG
jgi:hypothetical protein